MERNIPSYKYFTLPLIMRHWIKPKTWATAHVQKTLILAAIYTHLTVVIIFFIIFLVFCLHLSTFYHFSPLLCTFHRFFTLSHFSPHLGTLISPTFLHSFPVLELLNSFAWFNLFPFWPVSVFHCIIYTNFQVICVIIVLLINVQVSDFC